MSKTVSILLCGVILFLQSSTVVPQKPINHGARIETKYDGFAFETVMRLQKMKVNCNGFSGNFKDYCVSIDVALHCPGPQMTRVTNVLYGCCLKRGVGMSRILPNRGNLRR
jgi:hypothetical protein